MKTSKEPLKKVQKLANAQTAATAAVLFIWLAAEAPLAVSTASYACSWQQLATHANSSSWLHMHLAAASYTCSQLATHAAGSGPS